MVSVATECVLYNFYHPLTPCFLKCYNCSYSWIFETKCLTNNISTFRGRKYCKLCIYKVNCELRLAEEGPNWRIRFFLKSQFYCCQCKFNIYSNHKLSHYPVETVKINYNVDYPIHCYCTTCYKFLAALMPHKLNPWNCCRKHE